MFLHRPDLLNNINKKIKTPTKITMTANILTKQVRKHIFIKLLNQNHLRLSRQHLQIIYM